MSARYEFPIISYSPQRKNVTIIEKKNLYLNKDKVAYCCKLNIKYLLLYTCTNNGPPGAVTINNNI